MFCRRGRSVAEIQKEEDELPEQSTVADVLNSLNHITGGRVVTSYEDVALGKNPFVITKSSNIPGKSVTEVPGLVWGDPKKPVRKLAVAMTLTEHGFELAGAIGVDAIIAHHPVADAANSGGVPLKFYCSLYDISVFELHEAFHGLHPGIPFIHGHQTYRVDVAYGGVPGNIVFFGKALPEIRRTGDILRRLESFMSPVEDEKLLEQERIIRDCGNIHETTVATTAKLLNGTPESAVSQILHIFPHGGFSVMHLEMAIEENPEIDTIVCSISRVRPASALVARARELGLNFVVGNSHAVEIFENGLPLAYALKMLLPGVDVHLFRERVTSIPVGQMGGAAIKEYAQDIAARYLVKDNWKGEDERKREVAASSDS